MTAAADLRAVDRADVYVGDRLTAALSRDGKGVTTLDYRDPIPTGRTGGIAWSLPGPDSPFEVGGDALPAFFAGLLPEGVRLGVALTATKTSADDHFTLLLSVGSDTVGDVRVVPEGSEPRIRPPMVTDTVTDLREVFREFTSSFESDAVALAGVQPKVSASMWSTPTVTDRGPAILKLTPPSGFPKLVENEHFFMRMAAACGITAASTTIVEDESGVTGLLVERFDRRDGVRIPQEDACQVLDVYPGAKYRMKTEEVISGLARTCERGGGSARAATVELLRIVVFSWLIGNGDLHGKNLSIHAPEGWWRPTPAYDLLTTQPYLKWRDPMAMNLYGRANRLKRSDFIDAGERLGVGARPMRRMIDELCDVSTTWIPRCAEIGFADRDTERLIALLTARAESLTGS
jgi:serine/threonine-protein kinase HipA